MFSDLAQTIQLALDNNIDPMTSKELAEALDCTHKEAIDGLNELKDAGLAVQGIAGWTAVNDENEAKAIVTTHNAKSDLEKVLFLFATMRKRAFLRAIVDATGIVPSKATKIIEQLLDEHIIDCRTPGTHYLTEAGIDFIRRQYPAVEIPAYVVTTAQLPPPNFTLQPRKPKLKIPNLGRKITALTAVLPSTSGETRTEITELLKILESAA